MVGTDKEIQPQAARTDASSGSDKDVTARASTEPAGKTGVESRHIDNADLEALNRNAEARIKNPLAGIPYDRLMADVEAFTHAKGLTEFTDVFKQGALVAQDPDNYENLPSQHALSEHQKDALRLEVEKKWRMPMQLFMTIFTCSMGAAVQGWDQTGINGANVYMQEEYNIGDSSVSSRLILGLVNAGPYLGSALLGCWLSDPVNNWIGRRGVIFVSAHFCLWPVIGSAFCHTWGEQLACRLLMGVGMGIKASTVPIYAAENSPAAIRGALVMSWQMWTAFGIFLGTAFNVAMFNVDDRIGWRLMLGAPFIPAVPLVLLIYFCPESPRWYMKKNRYEDAWKSIQRLRFTPLQGARDIYYIHSQLVIENEVIGRSTFASRFVELFTIPRVRRATLAAFTVMLAQQMCGINIIAFYSTTLFVDAGFGRYEALLGSLGFGLVNWLFAFPAFWTIDTFGRRSLLLFTFPQMTWTLLAAGLCTLIDPEGPQAKARLGLVALFVFLFGAFYSPGEGPVPFTYSAEVFPLSHREVGMGFAVATCLFWASILGITLPFLLEKLQVVGVFGFYAGLNVVALVMIFLWVPETKQRTLEELDYVFGSPTSKFIRYQCTKALPWWFKRWVLFDRSAKLEPFYKEDRHSDYVAPTSAAAVGGEKKTAI